MIKSYNENFFDDTMTRTIILISRRVRRFVNAFHLTKQLIRTVMSNDQISNKSYSEKIFDDQSHDECNFLMIQLIRKQFIMSISRSSFDQRRKKVYFSWETANWFRVVKSKIHKFRSVTFEITHTLISSILWIIRDFDEMLAKSRCMIWLMTKLTYCVFRLIRKSRSFCFVYVLCLIQIFCCCKFFEFICCIHLSLLFRNHESFEIFVKLNIVHVIMTSKSIRLFTL